MTKYTKVNFCSIDRFKRAITKADKGSHYCGGDIRHCADCGQESKVIIKESDGRKWGYCGICEVG